MSVFRIYVEKHKPYDVEAAGHLTEIRDLLGVTSVTGLRLLNRYDVQGIDQSLFQQCLPVVFSEPQLDLLYEQLPQWEGPVFATEYLPGQFDQRADSCAQCIQLVSQGERPLVRTARVFLLEGNPSPEELERVKRYIINPVESREASLEEKDTLEMDYPTPEQVALLDGFLELDRQGLEGMVNQYGLAMDVDDAAFCQAYFRQENRNPTITELRMIDTYWSDHCRHTTFGTILDSASIQEPAVERAYQRYLAVRKALGREEKPITLMDLATIGARYLKKAGALKGLDESEEINACSVRITVDNNGQNEDWLLMFKNETHNHPTEIEPFGGAATCIGGAIRDPLSGRSYVYQAMRVTGAADPLVPVEETMPGKLPQRKLVTTAAAGYSSYGNQIGLATGLVDELYHPGYAAKRLEIGAVVGAAPARNVRREAPVPGDVVVLLGGRTGRDGCGGATGSSKAHGLQSLETCGAEVQKGNAPVERKLQRMFRDPEVTRLIKRCNDFGAGGVSVAIGELADGLEINLDLVPKKYEGLDGTELAISESQERMAVVLAPEDVELFLSKARNENLEATPVAKVTQLPRLRMLWKGHVIVDISREFLNSNGAEKHTTVQVPKASLENRSPVEGRTLQEKLINLMSDLNICSKKGLSERFDSTIGAATVLMPFGGKKQLTPAQSMVAKLPVQGETTTCSGMAWGFNPFLMEQSPYHGAYLAVVESVSKLVASGFRHQDAYLTFQEYFERLRTQPERWGKPFAALLGALDAQLDLEIAAIGGKDSMSGSFEKLDVPPTLVSFAVAAGDTRRILSPEFKKAGSRLSLLQADPFDPQAMRSLYKQVEELIQNHQVLSVYVPGHGGLAEALFKMGVGNHIGVEIADSFPIDRLFGWCYGSFLLELAEGVTVGEPVGHTTASYHFYGDGQQVDLSVVQEVWEKKLEPVMPYRQAPGSTKTPVEPVTFTASRRVSPKVSVSRPKALIPVFPGTNCEYDTARALRRAGAEPEILVIRNLTSQDIGESIQRMEQSIRRSQMVVLPGGFSGGDEPDGSGKFITAFFRNPRITDAIHELLNNRDGLMLGICNGFQALIKLGLVPYGRILDTDENCPTLTFNTVGRHQSMLVRTRIASDLSPWLSRCKTGEIHTVAISHGEGRFVAPMELVKQLAASGQIATQYVDLEGAPTMDLTANPNGSVWAVEGISSPDGRVFGKMGHTERSGDFLYKNVEGNKFQPLFEGGVDYFKL